MSDSDQRMSNDRTIPPRPPPPPPVQRNGCLTALMMLVGAILLLPGICTLLVDPKMMHPDLGAIALGVGGIVLIRFAMRRQR
jgi:hypothetical protein